MYIDTHAHINFNAYKDDGPAVIKRTLDGGVWMILVGSESKTSERSVQYASQYNEGVYAAVGLHPSHLFDEYIDEQEVDVKFFTKHQEFDFDFYKELTKDKKVVGIGECGLEYGHLPKGVEPEIVKAKQQEVLNQHIDLAMATNLPIIIHCRDGSTSLTTGAHDDCYDILSQAISEGKLLRRGVIHCFTGNWHDAERYLSLGFYISFTGIITFKPTKKIAEQHAAILDALVKIPLDKILIETDSPYLAPDPLRGSRNEPLNVKLVAKKIAELKGVSVEEVADATFANARALFKI